jgi:archaellum biogenesis ATPase FlaH
MEKVETTIIGNLIFNEDFSRKVLPFVKKDYFENFHEKVIFEEVSDFIVKYNSMPTKQALVIDIEKRTDLSDDVYKQVCDCLENLQDIPNDKQWLLDTAEKWCRDRAIYLALVQSISIADGNNEEKGRDAIPSILSDALSVSFDNHVGHDYLQDYEERYDFYHQTEEKIPFDLDFFNKITKGGLVNKSLNVALAGTGVGKSLFMCHMASSCLLQGKNVLYITMEMAEEKIAERIDANLLNVNIQEIATLPRQMFETKVSNISQKTQGSLIIKEYPTASAHSGHFKALLNELALKKSFRPDIIFIDYLNICASSRYRQGGTVNSYSYDVELTDTSESFGLPATADLMFALISTDELEELGQIMVKQLKNRYNDLSVNKRFVVGIDRAKMRLYDCEQSAQNDILDSGQEEEYNNEDSDKLVKKFASLKF